MARRQIRRSVIPQQARSRERFLLPRSLEIAQSGDQFDQFDRPEKLSQRSPPGGLRQLRGIDNVTITQFGVVLNNTVVNRLLPDNPYRTSLLIQNRSTDSIFIGVGVLANAIESLEIVAGGSYEPIKAPIDAIYAIGNLAAQRIVVQQGIGVSSNPTTKGLE